MEQTAANPLLQTTNYRRTDYRPPTTAFHGASAGSVGSSVTSLIFVPFNAYFARGSVCSTSSFQFGLWDAESRYLTRRSALTIPNSRLGSSIRRTDVQYSADLQEDYMSNATVVLAAIEAGDPAAAEQFLVLVYDELRRLAASKLAEEAPGQTLQPTALVHEAWLRLVGDRNPSFNDRTHFFRASAEAMRHILIDRARRKKTVRHGGGHRRINLEDFNLASPSADDQV